MKKLPIQHKIASDKIYIGFSGGVDSVAATHYLMQKKPDVSLIFVHHQTTNSEKALHETVIPFSNKYNLNLNVYHISKECVQSENSWRNERYKIFHSNDEPVITCHHLDDCVETWVWSSLHGNGKIIPYRNRNVIRPFRMLEKQRFIDYAMNNNLTWTEDESNIDTKYIRNHIRHKMMPDILKVNPGINKVVRKKVIVD